MAEGAFLFGESRYKCRDCCNAASVDLLCLDLLTRPKNAIQGDAPQGSDTF